MPWGSVRWGAFIWGDSSPSAPTSVGSLSYMRSLISAYGASSKSTVSRRSSISPVRDRISTYSTGPAYTPPEPTRAATTTEKFNLFLSFRLGGMSFINPSINISKTPDISADIKGWAVSDLHLYIVAVRYLSISAYIKGWRQGILNISASIYPKSIYDISARLAVVSPEYLSAAINAILPEDFPATLTPIWAPPLGARIGAHLPANLPANIFSVGPKDFPGWVRVVNVGTPLDLISSITPSGGYLDIGSFVILTSRSTKDIGAILRVRMPVGIGAAISSWAVGDIMATITHIHQGPDAYAIIKGIGQAIKNLTGFLVVNRAGLSDSSALIRTKVSARTGGKPYNIYSVARPFPSNVFMVGFRTAGLMFFSIEPIFGYFPDLNAVLNAIPFYRSSIGASIYGIRSGSGIFDGLASIVGVTPFITMSRITLSYVLFRSLGAVLNATGGYSGFGASIKPIVQTSTGTAADARYSSTTTVTRQVLATSRGFVVLGVPQSVSKLWTYSNNYARPDIRAFIYGWGAADISSFIRVWPYKSLSASIRAWDASHMKEFISRIYGFRATDFTGSITVSGGYNGLGASVNVRFVSVSFPAKINPTLAVLGRDLVAVYTKPFIELGASINFDSSYSCSRPSYYKSLGAFISGHTQGTTDILATIISGRNCLSMSAAIRGLKRIRPKLLTLYFRTRTRDSDPIYASIVGWGRSCISMSALITGMMHVTDIPTTITAVRYKPHAVDPMEDIQLVNMLDTSNKTTAEILFGAGVSEYIFDSVDNMLYSKDASQSWSVLIREKSEGDTFFDGAATNRSRYITNISDKHSFDEAVRDSLSYLVYPENESMFATITATGGHRPLAGHIFGDALDKISNLNARIAQVYTIPDMSASLRASGGYTSLFSAVVAIIPAVDFIGSTISGWGATEVAAEIVGIT